MRRLQSRRHTGAGAGAQRGLHARKCADVGNALGRCSGGARRKPKARCALLEDRNVRGARRDRFGRDHERSRPALRRSGRLSASDPIVTMTLQLKCITTSQASDLATPYLRTRSPAIYEAKGLAAVTIRGASIEVQQARRAIEEFDVKCRLPSPVGTPAPDIPPG